jgi:hypothetical protein
MARNFWLILLATVVAPLPGYAADSLLLRPDRVFTAEDNVVHPGWEVLVEGNRIKAVGPALAVPDGSRIVSLAGMTLLPGLIDIHSHLFLHPYSEASLDDQVLKEPFAYRMLLASAHARATLENGFTTLRDLGTEGASNGDVYLKRAIDDAIVPGPRLHVALEPSWLWAPMARPVALLLCPMCRARKKPQASTRLSLRCGTKLPQARTGSSCMRTTRLVRTARHSQPSQRLN